MNRIQYGLYMQYATIKLNGGPYSTTTQRDHTSENKNMVQMEGGSREEHEFVDDSESGPSSQNPNSYNSGNHQASPNPLRYQEESKYSEQYLNPAAKMMPTLNNQSFLHSAKSQGTPDATVEMEDERDARLEQIHLEIIPPTQNWPPAQQ